MPSRTRSRPLWKHVATQPSRSYSRSASSRATTTFALPPSSPCASFVRAISSRRARAKRRGRRHWPFFFSDTAPSEIYTLSLHDALPIFTDDGLVKILDFGLGKYRRAEPAFFSTDSTIPQGQAMTGPGTILGTVDYMSPEQAAGEDVD